MLIDDGKPFCCCAPKRQPPDLHRSVRLVSGRIMFSQKWAHADGRRLDGTP
ncbi:hypothetical protein [Georhizobium profundi]|jgi:hypothetical protein|uniref:hypothetical protein n=1 Tax=Georhizobium profundi TaxID=2341112 RepID=UPI0013DECB0A|nr:hypothetical protein [Georhizobium profundi]